MTPSAAALPHRISDPADIPPEQVYNGLRRLLELPSGPARDTMLGSVLTGLLLRGPRLDEVEAAVQAAISLDQAGWETYQVPAEVRLVGYTGSGKKSFKTFNISTSAALVAAAGGGVHVAKLGSRSASSVTGSRDFIQQVGANCDRLPVGDMVDLAVELGFGFFSIENRIPEFDRRYGGRFQTVHALSLALPALLSPVGCHAFVYGLAHPAVNASASLLSRFGLPDVTVVGSEVPGGGQVDELVPGGLIRFCRLLGRLPDWDFAADMTTEVRQEPCDLTSIAQHPDPRRNVATALRVLAGYERGSACDAVILNAALLMAVSGAVASFQDGVERARQVVTSGAALDVLQAFIKATGGSGDEVWSLLDDRPRPAVLIRPPHGRERSCSLARS